MPTLIRNVEVLGTPALLQSGDVVDIIWREGRPVVIAYKTMTQSIVEQTQGYASPLVVEFHATRPSGQACPTDTVTAINWNTVITDTHGMADVANINIRISGLYTIEACVEFVANIAGIRMARFNHNGTGFTSHRMAPTSSGTWRTALFATRRMKAGDVLKCEMYQTTGSGLNIALSEYAPFITVRRTGD
jgi:hypothetical protein